MATTYFCASEGLFSERSSEAGGVMQPASARLAIATIDSDLRMSATPGRFAVAGLAALALCSAGAGGAAGASDVALATAGAGVTGTVEALAGGIFKFVHGNLLRQVWVGVRVACWITEVGGGLNERADVKKAPRVIAGIGRVLLWNGGSLWIGHEAGPVQAHEHHAIQISLALTGVVRFRVPEERWSDYSAAMVRPHQRHEFDGNGQSVAQIFVEPETVQGRALLTRRGDLPIARLGDVEAAAQSLLRAYEHRAPDAELQDLARVAVAQLAGGAVSLTADARITRAIEWVRGRLKEPLTLQQAARVAHLSPSRFRHLFVSQTGISFRAYLLWARVSSAVGAAMGGMSWTEAAQAWGFADSAHLSRTCRRMFGIAPSMLLREAQRTLQ
jgi:AraC family transcriptional regulator